MYAQLGKIIFQGQFGPDSFSSTVSKVYAEHTTIEGKPRLQALGDSLEEISISILLNRNFTDPVKAIQEFRTYMRDAAILPYISGDGNVIGDFVITGISQTTTVAGTDGTIVEARLEISLKEYYSPTVTPTAQSSARAQAIALPENNPVPGSGPATVSNENQAAAGVLTAAGQADVCKELADEGNGDAGIAEQRRRQIARRMLKIAEAAQAADDLINAMTGDKFNDTRTLDTELKALVLAANNLATDALDFGGVTMPQVLADVTAIVANAERCRKDCELLTGYIISRK